MENELNKRKYSDWLMGVLCVIMFVGLIMACFYKTTGYNGFSVASCHKMKNSVHVTWGDKEKDTTLPGTIKNPEMHTIYISMILHENELGMCDSILFRNRQSRAKVYLDDALIYDSEEAFKSPFYMGYGSLWKAIQIGKNYDGKKLTIELQPAYKLQAVSGYLPEVYFGIGASFIKMILENAAWVMVLSLFLIGMGIYYIVNGLFSIHKTKSVQMLFLGLFSLDTGLWVLMESHVLELFLSNMQTVIYLSYITYGMMPVLFIRFLMGCEGVENKIYLKLLYCTGILLNMIQIFLAAAGIYTQFESQWLNRVYLVLTILGLLAALFSVRRIDMVQRRRRLYSGILIIVISTILELIYFIFVNKLNSGKILLIGISIFIFKAGLNLIRDGRKLRKEDFEKEILQKMAYTDGMTKLGNRFAYELEKSKLELNENTKVKVLVADMNGLKMANDNYGHSYGDKVICKTAELLEESFQNVGKCYRIGGDEFCVLAEDKDSEVFEKCIEDMKNKADRLHDTIKGYGIAYGVASGNSQDLDDIFREADNLMYTCKKEMKGNRS